jgi:hypothetical protein
MLMSALGVSGCSTAPFGINKMGFPVSLETPFASSDETQYLESKNAPDLVVQPPLTTSNLSGFYRLPPPPEQAKVKVLPPVS